MSSPKKQHRDKESKHKLEEIKKDNIEAEERQKSKLTQKENTNEGLILLPTHMAILFISTSITLRLL